MAPSNCLHPQRSVMQAISAGALMRIGKMLWFWVVVTDLLILALEAG